MKHSSVSFSIASVLLFGCAVVLFVVLLGYVSVQLRERSDETSLSRLLGPTLWRAHVVLVINAFLGYELTAAGEGVRGWSLLGLGMAMSLIAASLFNEHLWDTLVPKATKVN
ncbi:hypothetical protein AB4Y45_33480 [Paraburkholderia sp. EG287A]|uniref:hypothetical protein n=1 Tax=Paraburkholderia sp. EG287A TaxID=3237012 RepID=UPI0034D3619E